MLAMPRDKPIQIQSLQWQNEINQFHRLGSIGITLTNGSSSPMFTGLDRI